MKYIKEDIENILRNHSKNEAKKTETKLKIEEYQERLDHAGTVYEDTENEVIEAMQLSSSPISDIPKSTTNKISDVTADTAMRYKGELNHINKEDREYLERKISELQIEEKKLDKDIVRVKNLLTILNEKQEFVIKEFYINNKKENWKKVSIEFEKAFSKDLTIKQLQNIRDTALKEMLEVLNT